MNDVCSQQLGGTGSTGSGGSAAMLRKELLQMPPALSVAGEDGRGEYRLSPGTTDRVGGAFL